MFHLCRLKVIFIMSKNEQNNKMLKIHYQVGQDTMITMSSEANVCVQSLTISNSYNQVNLNRQGYQRILLFRS